MVYEDMFSVLIIQNAYKSYRVSFWRESRNASSPVRAKFRCREIEHRVCTVLKPLHPWRIPINHINQRVCVCVCVKKNCNQAGT